MSSDALSRHLYCPSCQFSLEDRAFGSLKFCPECRFPVGILAGRYRLDSLLARGGAGVLYLASQAGRVEPCVVKIMRPEYFEKPDSIARFHREIRVTQEISQVNQHIVQILDHGEETNVGLYYVMELLQGETLAQRMADEPLSLSEIFHILGQICAALTEAHARGIVHRDLKPENIFLCLTEHDSQFVKLLDFGTAKSLAGTVNKGLTEDALGTPHYMSPEQCTNQPVGPASDVYSLGIILYEMLTGTLPFDGESQAKVMLKHLSETPQPIHERCPELLFPHGLSEVVQKALAKHPGDRYFSAQMMWRALVPISKNYIKSHDYDHSFTKDTADITDFIYHDTDELTKEKAPETHPLFGTEFDKFPTIPLSDLHEQHQPSAGNHTKSTSFSTGWLLFVVAIVAGLLVWLVLRSTF